MTEYVDVPILLIAALSAVALLIAIRNFIRAVSERRHLATARESYVRTVSAMQTTEDFVRELTKDIPPQSMIARRVQLLFKTRQVHSISTNLLDRLDDLEDQNNYRFVRFVIGILLILGLLGTVVGLTVSIKGLMPAIQDAQKLSDVTILTTAMGRTLVGLETAFNATLAALAATFVLSLVTLFVQRFESRFIHELEEFLTFELIPRIMLSTEVEASKLYVEAVQQSAVDISHAADVLDRSRAGIQFIVDGLIQATRASEGRIVDFFNFAQTFKESVGQMIGYNDDLKETYRRIADVLREIQQNQVTHKIIGEVVDKAVARAMAEVSESAQATRQAFKDDIAAVMQSHERYTQVLQKTEEAIRQLSRESADRTAAAVSEAQAKVLAEFRAAVQQAQERENVSAMVVGEALEHFRTFVGEVSRSQEAMRAGIAELARRDDMLVTTGLRPPLPKGELHAKA